MGNHNTSYYSDPSLWNINIISQSKQIIQHKDSKQLYQKHILQVENAEIKSQNLIFQWRNSKQMAKHIVEIKHMQFRQKQVENNCGFNLCTMRQNNKILEVFTEYIYKLAQNTEFIFNREEQIQLFKDIIDSTDLIGSKFGYFILSKEMVGYNNKKKGKIWINQNFASNHRQFKALIKSKSDYLNWQKETILNLMNFCQFQQQQKQKPTFSYIIRQIKSHNLYDFDNFRKFFIKNTIQKVYNVQQSQSQIKSSLFYNNHGRQSFQSRNSFENQRICSTKDKQDKIINQKDNKQKQVIKQKKYVMVPVNITRKIYPVTQQQRQQINRHIRHTYHAQNHQNHQNHQHYHYQDLRLLIRQTQTDVKTQTKRNNFINKDLQLLIKDENNEATLKINHNTTPRKNNQNSKEPQDKKSMHSIQQYQQNLLMIESMIIVQNKSEQNQQDMKNTKIILQQSIILNGLNKRQEY